MDLSNSTQLVETAPSSEWRDPEVSPPPPGKKLMLLTEWGVAVLGHWGKGIGLVAWAPLPKVPPSIKRKLK